METAGIHHVTAIAGDAQRNLEFYTGLLGLRLVKLTVNFDDPTTYELFYGDEVGNPGSILSFTPWPSEPRGRPGSGQATSVAFSVPSGALQYWMDRLGRQRIVFHGPIGRFGDQVLVMVDPDGLPVELVACQDGPAGRGWAGGPVPQEHAIRGLHSVTITERSLDRMEWLLGQGLGFRQWGRDGRRIRFASWEDTPGSMVDLVWQPDASRGTTAVGTVHHVAFRTPDRGMQEEWRKRITTLELHVTRVQNRRYFHSIYFQETGSVLMEIATDGPGFILDETTDQLGRSLQLPLWLASHRDAIQRALPKLKLPQVQMARR